MAHSPKPARQDAQPPPVPHEQVTGTGARQPLEHPNPMPSARELAERAIRREEHHGGTPIDSDPRE